MLQADREEFNRQLRELCAGFNVPVGEREAAYWRSLAKMELGTFARVVEHCLGEEGPEKIPTTRQMWALSKAIRPRAALAPPSRPVWVGDRWDIEANLRLLAHIRSRGSRYAPDSGYDPVLRQVTAGPIARACTKVLLEWCKTPWAEDMRVDTDQTIAKRNSTWRELIERADAEINRILAGRRLAA